ncbi:MAG: ankyrin repeat domain-containing protein [Nitrospirota bacterium]
MKKRSPCITAFLMTLVSMALTGCVVTGGDLTTAAYEGQTPVIRELLDKGADVNERGGCGLWDAGGDFGATPLLCAAHGGHLESVQLLISRGADVNARGTTIGRTPLTAAAYARHAGIATLLIEKGADVNYAVANLEKHEKTKDGAVFLKGLAEKQQPAVQQATPSVIQSPMGEPPSGTTAGGAMPVAAAPVRSADTEREKVAYAETKTVNTSDAYEKFLLSYPSSENRQDALERMAGLISKRNGRYADYRKFVTAYEDGLEYVPVKYRLDLTGPEGMRVHDIAALRKKGIEDNLLCAKIRSGKGSYKDFSFEEIGALKKMGISALLIEAMIDSTTRAKREEEDLQKKKAMEDILLEIRRAQSKLADLKSVPSTVAAPATPVPVSASAAQSQGPDAATTVQNCTAQIAALEACRHLPSFGAMICKAAAKSQFPCE